MLSSMLSRHSAPLCACILLAHVAGATGTPPKVVSATPDNGATSVNPGTRSIRVEFNQDMAEYSHSWVGGGDTFPTIRGAPYWEGPRVAVLPVELKPDHEYALSINSSTFKGFQERDGQPAEPYAISFHTGPAGDQPDMALVAAAENRASAKVLRHTIDVCYSYLHVHKVDWDKAFAAAAPQLEAAQTPQGFAIAAGKLLAQAKDIHISVKYGDESFPVHSRSVPPNCNIDTLRKLVPNWEKRSARVVSGRFEDDIGYLLIATWDPSYAKALEAAYEALDDLADTKGLIIDVRMNAGGDEDLAALFAGCFTEKPVVYSRHVWRAVHEPGGFTAPIDRTLRPTKGRPKYRGRVAVLSGPHIVSSCESFLLMMKQVPGCKLVGERSYGGSGNPRPCGLPNGVVVYMPGWKDMMPNGTCFETVGIPPDVEVKAEAAAFTESDPVLDAALKLLRTP